MLLQGPMKDSDHGLEFHRAHAVRKESCAVDARAVRLADHSVTDTKRSSDVEIRWTSFARPSEKVLINLDYEEE
jgi:uncharacterized DUF497 family protein